MEKLQQNLQERTKFIRKWQLNIRTNELEQERETNAGEHVRTGIIQNTCVKVMKQVESSGDIIIRNICTYSMLHLQQQQQDTSARL